MEALLTIDNLVALVTLSAMEIVLGIDNLIFISILTANLPVNQQAMARRVGLVLALGMRIALLFAISWVLGLTVPLLSVAGMEFSGRDLILLAGGLFLIAKATWEIHHKLDIEHADRDMRAPAGFTGVVVQVMLLDIVFSLDSVITAVGMSNVIAIMVVAMAIAVAVMLFSVDAVTDFVERHPSITMLALSFLLLIGVMLVADGLGTHVPKGYIYFAMAFSVFVELLNLAHRKRQERGAQRRRGTATGAAGSPAAEGVRGKAA